MPNSATVQPRTNPAFFVQSAISFAVSTVAVLGGILALPLTLWVRAFLALGLLYVVTSTFTLAKVVRDRQETDEIVSRVDKARLERLLAEHDPFGPSV
jgi:hypothetical protein